MAAITPTLKSSPAPHGIILEYGGTGTANQTDTLTTPVCPEGSSQRLVQVTVKYSASPTQTGVLIGIDSHRGAAFDSTIVTGTANIQDTVFVPDEEIKIVPGSAYVVTAPAGGGVITASITITVEQR